MAIERVFNPADGRKLPGPARGRREYVERASGLRLRVTASGARSWCVTYWSALAGKARRLTLGDAAGMSLTVARTRARKALHAVDEGGDPFADRLREREHEREERQRRANERRRAAEERARRKLTFRAICERYIEERRTTPGGRHGRTARPRSVSLWEGMLRQHVGPTIGDRLPEALTAEDFARVLRASTKRGRHLRGATGGPTMPRNVLAFMSAVWRWLEQNRRTLGVTMPRDSPLLGLPQIGAKKTSRERVLTPREIWRLWRATEGESRAELALRFILLTATRVRETTELQWSELDLPAKLWRLPVGRNKGGRAREIPLSPQAIAILEAARPLGDQERPFGGARLFLPMKRIRNAMACNQWEPRDLRRTAATLCARLGADPFVVSLVLGHASADERMPAVTAAYLKWSYSEKVRDALNRLGAWVEATVSSEREPGDVIAFEVRS